MTVERAFLLLGIGPECSAGELSARFRKLAKTHHPDTGTSDSSVNHERMTLLNLAFETARGYIESNRPDIAEEFVPENVYGRNGTDYRESTHDDGDDRDGSELSREARTAAILAIDAVREAIFTYYQYGLENVHQRNEGAGRFRYREALRKLKSGIGELERVLSGRDVTGSGKDLHDVHRFLTIFLESIQLSRFYIPSPFQLESNGYRHYRAGGTALDLAIKDLFCPELNGGKRSGSFTSDKLQLIEKELLTVITRYYASSWISEAMIKFKLLEALCACLPFFLTES